MKLFPRKIVLIDCDSISLSNLNRMPGATLIDARQNVSKARHAERHILRFNHRQRVESIHGNFLEKANQRRFKGCDFFFSCFDRVAPRLAANQLCQAHGIQLFDCGVGAVVKSSRLVAAGGQIIWVRPAGGFCLLCSGIHSAQEAAGDFMSGEERQAQEHLGYIQGANVAAPQVNALNAMIAAQAIWLFQQLVAGWEVSFDGIAIDAKNHTMTTWTEDHSAGTRCPTCGPNGLALRGDSAPLLVKKSSATRHNQPPMLA